MGKTLLSDPVAFFLNRRAKHVVLLSNWCPIPLVLQLIIFVSNWCAIHLVLQLIYFSW